MQRDAAAQQSNQLHAKLPFWIFAAKEVAPARGATTSRADNGRPSTNGEPNLPFICCRPSEDTPITVSSCYAYACERKSHWT